MGGAWRRAGGRDGEAKQVRKKKVAVVSGCRLKREDCWQTKHDSAFSKWEILIGSSDWENYSLGKDGAERYRIHNLPACCSSPGLYELGVAQVSTNSRKFDTKDIVVVYLGQAENVRTRLQHYGRSGSHLEYGDPTALPNKCVTNIPQKGPGLFKEIFSRGFSIMFRWAPMRNKLEAMNVEARLLEVFDYAWNRIGNIACRRDDILLRLDKTTRVNPFHSFLQKMHLWKPQAFGKKNQGIKIITSEPFGKVESLDDPKCRYASMVSTFRKFQPILVQQSDYLHSDYDVCGVVKDDGSICKKRPVPRRKRCEDHRGKRISRSVQLSGKESAIKEVPICCGVFLEDGSICLEWPSGGRRRCNLHKGRRVVHSNGSMLPKSTQLN